MTTHRMTAIDAIREDLANATARIIDVPNIPERELLASMLKRTVEEIRMLERAIKRRIASGWVA